MEQKDWQMIAYWVSIFDFVLEPGDKCLSLLVVSPERTFSNNIYTCWKTNTCDTLSIRILYIFLYGCLGHWKYDIGLMRGGFLNLANK